MSSTLKPVTQTALTAVNSLSMNGISGRTVEKERFSSSAPKVQSVRKVLNSVRPGWFNTSSHQCSRGAAVRRKRYSGMDISSAMNSATARVRPETSETSNGSRSIPVAAL